MSHRQLFEGAVGRQDLDAAPVCNPGDCQVGHVLERGFIVQRRAQGGASLGKELPRLFRSAAFREVAKDADRQLDVPVGVEHWRRRYEGPTLLAPSL